MGRKFNLASNKPAIAVGDNDSTVMFYILFHPRYCGTSRPEILPIYIIGILFITNALFLPYVSMKTAERVD